MTDESQETITEWANNALGVAASNLSIAVRANQEMAELITCLVRNDTHEKAAEEAADVLIVLARLFQYLGVDAQDEINKKMAVNRTRSWITDGQGHGQHT